MNTILGFHPVGEYFRVPGTSIPMSSEPTMRLRLPYGLRLPDRCFTSISADRVAATIIHHSGRQRHQDAICVKVHKYWTGSASSLRATTQEFVLSTRPDPLLKFSPPLTCGNKYPAFVLRCKRRYSHSGMESRRPLFPSPLRGTELAARQYKTRRSSLCSGSETKWHIVAVLTAIIWVIQMLFQRQLVSMAIRHFSRFPSCSQLISRISMHDSWKQPTRTNSFNYSERITTLMRVTPQLLERY